MTTEPGVQGGSGGPVVRAEGLRKVYGEGDAATVALDEASVSLAEHEFVALVGPSGSGKTTLLSIVGALLRPTAGTVVVGGEDVTHLTPREQTRFRGRRVGFVFQSFNLVPFLTARENLLVAAQVAGRRGAEVRRQADELLGELGLSRRTDHLPGALSGGERQRVAIGRALMNDPDVVLVDEPTANLDTKLGTAVVQLIAEEVKKRGKAGIMVTHDQRMVEFTDRVVEILDGRIRA